MLYELVGPACAKLSLYLSGSYSNKIEDLAPVAETGADDKPRSEAEILIERIQRIQRELPVHSEPEMSEEEAAFTQAALEQSEYYHSMNRRRLLNRR